MCGDGEVGAEREEHSGGENDVEHVGLHGSSGGEPAADEKTRGAVELDGVEIRIDGFLADAQTGVGPELDAGAVGQDEVAGLVGNEREVATVGPGVADA